jgi:hypothetical protein
MRLVTEGFNLSKTKQGLISIQICLQSTLIKNSKLVKALMLTIQAVNLSGLQLL